MELNIVYRSLKRNSEGVVIGSLDLCFSHAVRQVNRGERPVISMIVPVDYCCDLCKEESHSEVGAEQEAK